MKYLLFILLFALPLSVSGEIYAIFIGVSEYEQSDMNLINSHKDAIEMHEILKEYTIPENMKLLTDKQAKHDIIVYYTKKLFHQAKPQDIVIFYFSGHGLENAFLTHDKILKFSALYNIFKETKAKRKLIFADACYSGSLKQPDNQSYSDDSQPGNNVLLFLSSRSDQRSYDGRILGNGIFTHYLLAGLKGEADYNNDRYITAIELHRYVNPKVKNRSKGKQNPIMWGKFDKNMIILKLKEK